MSDYAIFFDYDNKVYQLPVNPEQIEVSNTLAIEKYEILKAAQIAIPSSMELSEYSFEVELPHEPINYIETPNKFKDADYYLKRFKKWREALKPVRFIASNGIGDDIYTLVLIEELTITEKAGEEGDKYVSFKLLEYRPYGKHRASEVEEVKKAGKKILAKKKAKSKETSNPKSNGYHIVKPGESLWIIAKKYYGDGSKNYIIYNANKNVIKNPNILKVGWKLKIPAENEFNKYSTPLPVMKTEKAEKTKSNKTYTYISDKPVAGISLTLENGKYTHSGGGRTFGGNSDGGRTF